MVITIEKVQNGYLLTGYERTEEGDIPYHYVIEEPDDSTVHEEIVTFQRLVWQLQEEFCIRRDKFSEPEHRFTCKCVCEED